MKRQISTFMAILVAGLMVISCDTDTRLDNLSQQLEDMRNDVDSLQNQLDSLKNNTADSEEIYENGLVDQPAAFKGGQAALMRWIGDNLVYPKAALDQELQGTVIAKLLITDNGKVVDCKIMKSLSAECDAEVLRLSRIMPDFLPAVHKGHSVFVYFTLPIRFMIR